MTDSKHEAPASEGLRIVDEASDTKPAMFEAPADGAGEDGKLLALRARSSAPEARS